MNLSSKVSMAVLIGCQALWAVSCSAPAEKQSTAPAPATVAKDIDYTAYVDPYIGSGYHGHVFVGASVPFGMVQAGPSNIHKGWDWCSAYHYSDSVIIGFSHTHLSGTGCTELGDILVMPYMGKVRTQRGQQDNIKGACSSYYSHDNEKVAPGYYSLLMDNGIKVELTTSERAAMHRYTFPAGESHILVNLKEGNGDESNLTYIKKLDDNTIEGYRFSRGWSPYHKVFFVMRFEQPIKDLLVYHDDEPAGKNELRGTGVKGVVTFQQPQQQVKSKVAISSVSCANALANLEAEMNDWDFERVQSEAKAKWNKELAAIDVTTNDERAKKIFYTSMFHAFIAPTLYCDVNKQFRGNDNKIYTADNWTNYSTFSLWDTYRTLNPMFTIIKPQYVDDMVNSMLSIFEQQGKLPIWPLVGGETECMPGYSAVPIIADAYLKGFKGFDAERAYKYMTSSANYDKQQGVPDVLERGYIPCDKRGSATSISMEYAADDWGIALMAKKMGKKDDYKYYLKRGHYYERYWDKSIGFIRPILSDGSWRTPYDPCAGTGDFCEGNGWQYTFFVPQNPEGLIELMGGDEKFCNKLDEFFTAQGELGEHAAIDITGLVGMYAHGNEPSHHIAYMYPYAGQQWKTAEKVNYIQTEFYTDQPEGIIGNEDCGQMSAWHIMSALGIFQVNPSNGILVFGTPRFDRSVINLPEGKTFEIVANNVNKDNIYIQSVKLNGKNYTKTYITYDDVMNGGNLTFEMGGTPNKEFGAAAKDRPVSAR